MNNIKYNYAIYIIFDTLSQAEAYKLYESSLLHI